MPKTLSPTQVLAENIERLEAAIADKEREFLSQQQENIEYAESLSILATGTAKYIPQGKIAPLDALTRLLEEGDSEADRQYRWDTANQALKLSKAQSASLQSQIDELRRQLAIAQEELIWQTDYAPHAERYRAGFLQPSPAAIKAAKVQALSDDIKTYALTGNGLCAFPLREVKRDELA